jgi:hypothetical protein
MHALSSPLVLHDLGGSNQSNAKAQAAVREGDRD